MSGVSVIIPAHNEAGTVGETVTRVRSALEAINRKSGFESPQPVLANERIR